MRATLCVYIFLCLHNIAWTYNGRGSYSYQFVERYHDGPNEYRYNVFDAKDLDSENKWLCIAFGICAALYPGINMQPAGISSVYQWTHLDFDYPSKAARDQAIANKEFVIANGAPIDVDVHYSRTGRRIFVTVPRFQHGMPATLGILTDKTHKGNPLIAPYPSWSWHQNPNSCLPNRIVSVFRIKIDECGRLWVLDSGRHGENRVCPPQILAFNLETDQLVHRYEIPSSQLESDSILVTPVVDVRDPQRGCRDTFVYVADCQVNALIVHDVNRHTSWRIIDKTFYPYPNFGTYHIAGEHFDLMDGLLGMDLSPLRLGHDRVLFYHAMSSATENWVYTSHIRNQSIFVDDPSPAPEIFHTYPRQRKSQSASMAIDGNGIAYFGLATECSINCWNIATDYGDENIGVLAEDVTTLQFASGIKVITNKQNAQELWFITMRFQKIATGTLNTGDVNFRLQAAKLDDLTRGSKCRNGPSNHHQGTHHAHRPIQVGGYGFGRETNKRNVDSARMVHFPSD